MWQRIKAAWRFLTGKYPVNKIPSVYVHDGGPENRFVQLLVWRDSILALDAEGKIWQIEECGNLVGRPLGLQMIMESPRRY